MKKTKQSFFTALYNAFNGLFDFFSNERNGKIQLAVALATIATAAFLKISLNEWVAVLLCIGMVIGLEMLNSALEKLCDLVEPGYHPSIRVIKDISAGAVLWASIISTVAGTIIFLPKIISLL